MEIEIMTSSAAPELSIAQKMFIHFENLIENLAYGAFRVHTYFLCQ